MTLVERFPISAAIAVNDLKDHPQQLKAKVVQLCHVPEWMQRDSYIKRGYRLPQNSFVACFDSLWYIHNETISVWSHLLSGIFFLSLFIWSNVPYLHGGYSFSSPDLCALQSYFLGATLCLFFSSFYHCVSCHSEGVARWCIKLDYLGIVFNITSTSISATYFGLYDEPLLARFYITLIVICGCATFWTVLNPDADGPNAASWRSIIFIALGASGSASIIHAFLSAHLSLEKFPMPHIVAASAFYLLGTTFYVTRTPEKHWPHLFDIWGASHQIFHVMVNLAQISYLLGLRSTLLQIYK